MITNDNDTADAGPADEHGDIERRLDRLEEQQETIESQQDRIEEQAAIIEEQRDQLADDEDSDVLVNRRTALKAGGVLGLLGLGAGTASADPSGQIGTSSDSLQDLYTETLHGYSGTLRLKDNLDLDGNKLTNTASINGGFTSEQITDIEGTGLSVNSGALDASGASAWSDGDAADLLEPSDGTKTGIEVNKIDDNGSAPVSMQSGLNLSNNDLKDSGTTLWDSTAGNIPGARIADSGITTSQLATDAVDTNELATDAVTSTELDSGNIADLSQVVGSSVTAGAALDMGSNNIQNTGTLDTGTVSDTGSGLTVTTTTDNLTLNPSGTVDVSSNTLTNVSAVNGGITSSKITELDGSGLTVNNNSLETTGSSKWTGGSSGSSWLEPSDGGDTKLEGIDTIESNDASSSLTITQDTNDDGTNSSRNLTLKTVDTGNSNYPGNIVLDADPNNNDSRKISLKTGGTERATVDSDGLAVTNGSLDVSSGDKMSLPQVTSDPSASAGEMWYRSDLD
jgi:hypothetical protein